MDETSIAEEASALSAMMQSGGYIFASLIPFPVRFIHDYTGSFPTAAIGLIFTVAVMIGFSFKIGNKKAEHMRNGDRA
ncbi:hypothetical protein [Brevibacillus laterosporus]|uniref:hypothetical protein n=1 Tax=Brevibacillus laterosporus TaxID=1465 RepID=UPI00265CF830|nr:hypothetical protein [Brevibacillus laterosporus]